MSFWCKIGYHHWSEFTKHEVIGKNSYSFRYRECVCCKKAQRYTTAPRFGSIDVNYWATLKPKG
jgi:hypothetical protein